MAAKEIIRPYWLVGSSTDQTNALTDFVNTPVGSRFFCTTDGCWYVLSNDGATWVKVVSPAS